MSGDIPFDLGSALPYVEQRFLEIFGKDDATQHWQQKIKDLARISLEQASFVQSVGMYTPVPIEKIYQPTRLTQKAVAIQKNLSVRELIHQRADAVIFAGPGRGKTTLLHHLYVSLANNREIVPVLFTLRWPEAPGDLVEFVEHLARRKKLRQRIVFLVDGYDEISSKDRHLVSRALLLFKNLGHGQFLLTCRSLYDVPEIIADQYDLESFSTSEAIRFVEAFSEIYKVTLDARKLISELQLEGFDDFISHPLMLTLVCILRTGPNPDIPRRAIGLIRRAIETLTFRWDEAKHVSRSSQMPLDGEERVRCLMRVAFSMQNLQATAQEVEAAVNKHLELIQLTKINAGRLIEELARWYGILVPLDDNRWQFVHRTIHDYLAARFWVESGIFASTTIQRWDMRAAYAVCLLPEATNSMIRMLDMSSDLQAFLTCLSNRAPFDVDRVALGVVARAHRLGQTHLAETSAGFAVRMNENFYTEAGPEFLRSLVKVGSTSVGHNAGYVVACYALEELHRRGINVSQYSLGGRLADQFAKYPLVSLDVFERSEFPLASVISNATN